MLQSAFRREKQNKKHFVLHRTQKAKDHALDKGKRNFLWAKCYSIQGSYNTASEIALKKNVENADKLFLTALKLIKLFV